MKNEQIELVLFAGLRQRSDGYAMRWALNGFARKKGNVESFFRGGGRVATSREEMTNLPNTDELGGFHDSVKEAQSIFFEAACGVALPLLRRAVRLGINPDLQTLRAICKRGSVLKAAFKAVEKWEYSAIRGRDGREVPAEWFNASRLSATRPNSGDGWGDGTEDDEKLNDCVAVHQVEDKREISDHRRGLLRDVRLASAKLSASISERVEAATSGAAAAAVRRSGANDLRLLESLEGFLERGESLPAMDWNRFFNSSKRGLKNTGRSALREIRKRIA